MWTCTKCAESCEDSFDACWKCGTSREGTAPSATVAEESGRKVDCLRCKCRLLFVGTKEFHEGSNLGIFGPLGELLVDQERFELYRCPKCGKVEFFVRGPEEGTA
jgi:hypothetical protein